MLRPEYPIETERLLLRPFTPDDVDAVHGYQSREDVCRYIPYPPRSRETIAERIAPPHARTTIDDEGDALILAVELRALHRVVGDVMLCWTSREHRSGEIGYVFDPVHHGQGYATEAVGALLQLAFDGLDLRRVVGRIDARNAASGAVLRRAGLRQEAHLVQNEWFKGEWTDEIGFAILADEWRRRSVRRVPR